VKIKYFVLKVSKAADLDSQPVILFQVCLPYVPATDVQLENVIRSLSVPLPCRAGNTLVDIGSGDGRVVGMHLLLFPHYQPH